jgi:cell division protein ZapE
MPYSSPLNQYQALVNFKRISFDESQQQAVALLQQLYVKLQPTEVEKQSEITAKVPVRGATKNKEKTRQFKGIYLWGKVGRGKTFLMDLLVNSLPNSVCNRQHFHHFMQGVHRQLNILSGQSEPLKIIARKFSQQYRVLCFDEFFVSDIGDAMLLGNLLQFMFELDIVVVCTSNCAPSQLYLNGLQRDRFLPAIAAIEDKTQILHLTGDHDHRLRTLTYAQNYFELATSEEPQITLHQTLLSRFDLNHKPDNKILILGRFINIIAQNNKQNHRVICFEFSALCQGARSHFDYIELAKQFTTILLFNVPPMSGQTYERIKARGTEDNGSNINVSAGKTGEREVLLAPMDDAARRFIALVDESYDCNINLFITAYTPLSELYNSGSLMFEFERTKSRLIEMASVEYRDKT